MDTPAAERHIYSRLRTRTALSGVKKQRGSTGPDFVGVAYRLHIAEEDMIAVGEDAVAAPLHFQVLAVCAGEDDADAVAWAREAEAALKRSAPARNEHGEVFACYRVKEVSFDRRKDGRAWCYRGAIWRLIVRGRV